MANDFTQEDVQRIVDERLREAQEAHRKEMDDLRLSLAGVQPSPVPEHSGGPGTEIHGSWSQYDQELAARGEHPLQQQGAKKGK